MCFQITVCFQNFVCLSVSVTPMLYRRGTHPTKVKPNRKTKRKPKRKELLSDTQAKQVWVYKGGQGGCNSDTLEMKAPPKHGRYKSEQEQQRRHNSTAAELAGRFLVHSPQRPYGFNQ